MTLMELAQPTRPADALVVSSRFAERRTSSPFQPVVDALAHAIAAHDGAVIVDLTHTEFIDSGTVGALARAWQFLGDRGRTLTLRSPSRVAVRVLRLLGFSHLIEPDRATAQ